MSTRETTGSRTAERATPDRRTAAPDLDEVRRRQREEYGGLSWGSAFFGWLVAVGVATLLIALLSAAGAAVGLTDTARRGHDRDRRRHPAAGRPGRRLLRRRLRRRPHGPLQRAAPGLAVWLLGLIVTVVLAVAGVLLGAEYNVLAGLNLPRIPVDEGALTTGGLIALAAVLIGTLLAAIAGGKAGSHYHRKVDRVGH